MGKSLLLFFFGITLISPGFLQPIWPNFEAYSDLSNEMNSDIDDFDNISPSFISRKIDEDLQPWLPPMSYRPRPEFFRNFEEDYKPVQFRQIYKPANIPMYQKNMEDIPIFKLQFGKSFQLDNSNEENTNTAPELTSEEIGSIVEAIETISLLAKIADILDKLDDLELENVITDSAEAVKNEDATITAVSANNPNVDIKFVIPNFDEVSEEITTITPFIPNFKKRSSEEESKTEKTAFEIFEEIFKDLNDNRPLDEELDVSTLPTLDEDNEIDASSSDKTTKRSSNEIPKNIDNEEDELVVIEIKPDQKTNDRETEWDEDSDEYNEVDVNLNDIQLLGGNNAELPLYKVVHRK